MSSRSKCFESGTKSWLVNITAALSATILLAGCTQSHVQELSVYHFNDGVKPPIVLTVDGAERQWIRGGTIDKATFSLEGLTQERFPEAISHHLQFAILRTPYEGARDDVFLEFRFKNPHTNFTADPHIIEANPQTGASLRVLSAGERNDVETIRLTHERNGLDLFPDVIHEGKAELAIRLLDADALLGVRQSDLTLSHQTTPSTAAEADPAPYQAKGSLLDIAVEATRQAWADYDSRLQDFDIDGETATMISSADEQHVRRKWQATLLPHIKSTQRKLLDSHANDSTDTRFELAVVHLLMGQPGKAIELLEQLDSPKEKERGVLHYLRGERYYEAGQVLEAAEEFTSAVEADPENAWAYDRRKIVNAMLDRPYYDDAATFRKLEGEVDGVRRTLPWLRVPPVCDEIRELTRVVPGSDPDFTLP